MPARGPLIIDLVARDFAAYARAPLGADGRDAWVFDVDGGRVPTCVMAFSEVAMLAARDTAEGAVGVDGAEHRGGSRAVRRSGEAQDANHNHDGGKAHLVRLLGHEVQYLLHPPSRATAGRPSSPREPEPGPVICY